MRRVYSEYSLYCLKNVLSGGSESAPCEHLCVVLCLKNFIVIGGFRYYVKSSMYAALKFKSKECAKIIIVLSQVVGLRRMEISGRNGTIWVRTARRRERIGLMKRSNSLDSRALWAT